MAIQPSSARLSRNRPSPDSSADYTVAFNGTTLSVDTAAYLAQHDLVYLSPPGPSQAVNIGDGDLGAMFWQPGPLRWQIQKNDLWDDPPSRPDGSHVPNPAVWRQLSAGALTLRTEPNIMQNLTRYELRLSLYSGTVTLQTESPTGSCQITMFVSATAGVMVIDYQDQTLRATARNAEISQWRNASLFAQQDTVGILQALRDRRYALMMRMQGHEAAARQTDSRHARLEAAPCRSCGFTLYLATATSPRDGDPVAVARGRLQGAMTRGYNELLREHRQHWTAFWQKSFVRLESDIDPLAGYLENLWYLNLYHLASCSRGYDAPLPDGAVWLSRQDERPSPALYRGTDLRAMLAPMLPANHLELSVPYVETYHRMLPDVAARTGLEQKVAGAHFPARFNRHGHQFASAEGTEDPLDGLHSAMLIWDAWRFAPDPFFLRERAYPLLRACAESLLEKRMLKAAAEGDLKQDAALAAALRALLWASEELDIDQERRREWRNALEHLPLTPAYRSEALQTAEELRPVHAAAQLRAWLLEQPQSAQGWFAPDRSTPSLTLSGQLLSLVNSMLLRDEPLPRLQPAAGPDFGGAWPAAIQVFAALPSHWNGAFALAAPGGFRVCGETHEGKTAYIAVRSLLGNPCRLANPWGTGQTARVMEGRQNLLETSDGLLEWPTKRGSVYLIELPEYPISRAVRGRFTGRRTLRNRVFGPHTLGLDEQALLQKLDATQSSSSASVVAERRGGGGAIPRRRV